MRLHRVLLAAAFLAAIAAPAPAAQFTYTQPVTGPLSMADYSAGLNDTLSAVISNNSGSSAPAVTGQPATYQWWVDTSTAPRILKFYDGTSWLSIASIDASGHLLALLGSSAKLTGTTSGTVTLTPLATAGTPTLTFPNTSGTFAVGASSPLVLNTTTGNLTCATCVTSSGGGAISGTAPVAVSAGGVVSITGAAGQVLAGSSPAFTATPTLGVAGATVGTLAFANATSGSITVSPPTGALGTVTLTLPAATDTLVGKATTDTLTNKTLTAPVMTAPVLGTPASGTMTNVTGLPISTGVSGLGTGIATALATPSSANWATAFTDETGSGTIVFSTSPALTTPDLGTPSAATLTNATGLPVSTGISGLGTGVATFLATPSSANFAAAVTGETGTGAAVFATSPALVTPDLGTPTAATLTNATGLPISTGVSGLGTGVATFLATPSSANLASALTDETGTGAAVLGTSPTIATPVINGLPTGTGVDSAATASTLASRDVQANLSADAFIQGYTTTATAAGTTTLTNDSTDLQYFTGSTTQTVSLPVTSTLVLGRRFWVVNNSSGTVTVNSSGGNLVLDVASGNTGIFTVILTSGTSAASWSNTYISSGAGTGTVTSVTCGTGLSGGTFTTTGTCSLSTPVSVANGGTGISSFATGIATFLGTSTSANLASAVTDETGSGALAFATSPVFTTDITVPNTGLHVLDTNASHDLIIKPGSDVTADRTLTVTTGDTDITADLTDAGSDKLMFWDDSAGSWTALTLPPNLVVSGTSLRAYEVWGCAVSDETTAITTGTAKCSWSMPYAVTVAGVYCTLNTVSSSGTPTFDINEDGTTIISTKVVIDVSEKTGGSSGYQGTAAGAAVISDSAIAAFAQMTVDIDTAGTGAKGAKCMMIVYP